MTTINGIELKPCPFCGRDNIRLDAYFIQATEIGYYVMCLDCHGAGGGEYSDIAAIEAWNQRVDSSIVWLGIPDAEPGPIDQTPQPMEKAKNGD